MPYIIRSSLFMFFITTVVKGPYVPKWSCDFEDGFCDWYKVDVNGFGWEHSADSPNKIKDHTKDSVNGSFTYILLGQWMRGDAGKLVSPLLRPVNGSCKMVFYFMGIGNIYSNFLFLKVEKVIKKLDGISRVRLFYVANRVSSWRKGQVTLNSDVDFQVEIMVYSHLAFSGKLALDDVMFTEGCFTQELTPIKIVKPQSLPKYNFPEGVFYERTGNSWSMVCDKDKALAACRHLGCNGLADSTLVERGFKSGQEICLLSNNTLSNSSSCHNSTGCINATFWRCKSEQRMTCPRLTHNTCTSGAGSPMCYDHNQRCDFHKDCPGGEDEEDCIEYKRCDFQNDFCNWIPSKQTTLRWQRTNTREGNHCYLKADSNSSEYDQGKLLLKDTIEGSPNVTCVLRFSYQFNKDWRGSLQVFSLTSKTEREIDWIRAPNWQGWLRENLILPTRGNFKIRIDVLDTYHKGIFKLTNMSLSPDCLFRNHTHVPSSRSDIFACHSGEDISSSLVCNLNADCFDGSDELNCKNHPETCTFENSLCNWRIEENATKILRRRKGYSPRIKTVPSKDHTNKFVSYQIHLDARCKRKGHSGYLISGLMQQPLSGKCTFRWFYYISNRYGNGKLEVMYYDPMSRIEKILWTNKGYQVPSWKYGNVNFYTSSLFYRIKLKITCGDYQRNHIAIDDVSFTEDCYNVANYTALTINQVCNTGQVMYKVENRSASIFYEYNTKLGSHLRCQWLITADPRLRIHLSAEYFYTAYNDKVLIRHDHSSTISGVRAPFYLVSPSNILRVGFNATHMNNSQGFVFNISSTDEQTLPAIPYGLPSGSGNIELFLKCRDEYQTSQLFRNFATIEPRLRISFDIAPSYRIGYENYYSYEDCVYKFHASNGYRMRFNFTFFLTESGPDYVEVLSGIIGKGFFSGYLDPFHFVSKGSWLSFRFKTDGTYVERGFILKVTLTTAPAIGVTTEQKISIVPSTSPVSAHAMTPAKKGSIGNLSAKLIASSLGILAFLVLTFILIKYIRIRKRQRAERSNRGADHSLPVQIPDVCYAPDPVLGDVPPSYSDATKEGIFFVNTSNAFGAFSLRNDPPPPFEVVINGAADAFDLPPKYNTVQSSSPIAIETPSGAGAQLNKMLTLTSQLSNLRVELPAVDGDDSRPGSAALTRSRPASAASVDSVSDPLHPLVRPTTRQQRNPNRTLPSPQVRVRATDNRSPGTDS
ncbi:MAM and LDL-receptor class A domain-containing protein 2-like isoform X1 [Rhopilema esculentum]|uniref:MAM and LDL-receptor class A domain-containing protein 2-like isoform X1 n=1 Tax=Rhopilema esculentum TaxID=499914 RepID=UPI0031D636D5